MTTLLAIGAMAALFVFAVWFGSRKSEESAIKLNAGDDRVSAEERDRRRLAG